MGNLAHRHVQAIPLACENGNVLLDGGIDRARDEKLHRIPAAVRDAWTLLVDHQGDVATVLAPVELGLSHGVPFLT